MLSGAALTSGGMYWFSHISVHTTYLDGLIGPVLVTAAGLGLLFVPLSLVVLSRVRDEDSGLVSSLLNTGQQVGGAIGLAALGTVAWTTVANSTRSQVSHTITGLTGHTVTGAQLQAVIHQHALAAGISRGLLVASAIAFSALVIAAVTIRVRPHDLAALTGGTPGEPEEHGPASAPYPATAAPEPDSSAPTREPAGAVAAR